MVERMEVARQWEGVGSWELGGGKVMGAIKISNLSVITWELITITMQPHARNFGEVC